MKRIFYSSWMPAILIGAVITSALLLTCQDIGLTWDEPDYFKAAESYTGWFKLLLTKPQEALTADSINRYWEPNHEHPPLDKIFSGAIWLLARRVLDDLTAHRLGNILLAGILAAILYRMISAEGGFWAGLISVFSLFFMPRFFFHAHLAALDVPAAAMIVFVAFFFWHTRFDSRIRRTLILGILWGIAISTKVNAFFVLPILFFWALLFHRKKFIFLRLVLASVIGTFILLILWPWLYCDPIRRLLDYFQFLTVSHWQIAQFYLGKIYMPPPWHFPFVMVWAVIPIGTSILYLCGILRFLAKRELLAFGSLLFLNAFFPLAVLAIGQSMVYDNERLLMPAFPFLAALAGLGFVWITGGLQKVFRQAQNNSLIHVFGVLLLLLWVIPLMTGVVTLYPHLLSYYSEGVGGLPGAVGMGLETTYWSETDKEAVEYINQHAKPGDTIWKDSSSYSVLIYYQLHGILRKDVFFAMSTTEAADFGTNVGIPTSPVDFTQASFVVLPYRQTAFFDSENRMAPFASWATARSFVYRLEKQGVPLMDIYSYP